jgi:hypothetical protein
VGIADLTADKLRRVAVKRKCKFENADSDLQENALSRQMLPALTFSLMSESLIKNQEI